MKSLEGRPYRWRNTFCLGFVLVFFIRFFILALKFQVSEKDLKALYVEANTFSLASHVFWALWGLIQAKMSPIEFNYLCYFFLRYKEYKRQKEKCFLLARTYRSGSKNE